MRVLPWNLSARRREDDPAVHVKMMALTLRDCCAFAAWCAAENRPRNVASFNEWEATRLPARATRSLAGVIA
jgi:hypothetical protein